MSNVASLFQVSKDELTKLVQGFDKQDILTSSGVTLAGNRYIYLSGTDKVIRAKLGKVGVHCVKTQQGKCSFYFCANVKMCVCVLVGLQSCHL